MDGTWIELADGVFARRYAELDLTVGLVIGADRALVVDTRGDRVQGAEWAAAVRERTRLPITVVLTHAHFDHCFGTSAFGPVPVLAHPRCGEAIARTADRQRIEWVAHYRDRGDDATADALAASTPVPPTPAPPRIDLGWRIVVLRHLGRGHTDHDLLVDVPDAGVVFAGDLVEQGAPPDLAEAHPAAWPATLTALLELGRPVVVPGHGEPVDAAFVAEQRDRLMEIADLHQQVRVGGLSATEAEHRSPYPGAQWQ
jgi:glyoxylase-like metal-dependent hydrolase (beta-lactamase superfamily II)